MSGKAQTNWLAMALVAGISAAIGFGAVYVIAGGGDNEVSSSASRPVADAGKAGGQAARQGAAKGSDAAGRGDVTGQTPAKAGGQDAAQGDRAGAAANAVGSSAPRGPGGEPLNRGEMATFVFKKAAMDLPEGATFNDGEGREVGIDRFAGKVVLMNLWATWCAPCRKEMPDLDKLQAELGGDDFEVVAVSLDRGSPDKARAFLDEIGIKSLAFYHDPDARLGFKLMAIGMPTTLLIDAKGREVGRLVGPAAWHSPDAKKLIKAVLAAQGS